MPNRIIREGILSSITVNELSEAGEIFYRRLMSIVDDFGRAEADLDMMRLQLFPRQLDRWPVERIREALIECTRTSDPLVSIYTVDSKNYLQIHKFGSPRAKKSKCPDPPLSEHSRMQTHADARTCKQTYAHALPEPSTNTNTNTNTNSNTNSNTNFSERETTETGESARRLAVSVRKAEPEPDPTDAEAEEFSAWAEAAYARHPKKKHKHLALLALKQRFSRDPAARERFDENHRLWCATPDWLERGGRFCPPLCELDGHGFVNDDGWIHPPVRGEPDVGKRDAGSYLRGRLRELEAKGEMAK